MSVMEFVHNVEPMLQLVLQTLLHYHVKMDISYQLDLAHHQFVLQMLNFVHLLQPPHLVLMDTS